MTWLKLSDSFAEECEELSDRAFRLHVDGLCFAMSRETGGQISRKQFRRIAACKSPQKAAEELVDRGFWSTTSEGWQIKHHMDHQPSPEEIEARRAEAASRKRDERRRKVGLEAIGGTSQCDSQHESQPESRPCPGRDGTG